MNRLSRSAPLLCALVGLAAFAADPVDEETGRRLVDSFVEDITTFSAGFEQVFDKKGNVFRRHVIKISGQLKDLARGVLGGTSRFH